jgi:sirohydrochlorin cobaltochelatase
MLCGHGSRDGRAVAEFAALAETLRGRFPDWPVAHGYLEFAAPIIREGLDRLVGAGATRILAVPGMLFAAGHAKNDIPSVLNTYKAARPGRASRKRSRAATCRGRRRCSSSSGAGPPTRTQIRTSPR